MVTGSVAAPSRPDARLPDLRRCTPGETSAHARYLSETPVRGLVRGLRDGTRPLFAGRITSHRQLGLLPTIFGDIGGHTPSSTCGRATFLVSEVLPLLRDHPLADPRLLLAIEAFMAADVDTALESSATVLRSELELMLVDGNKRTIAFYERRLGCDDRIDYPVFVIGEPSTAKA